MRLQMIGMLVLLTNSVPNIGANEARCLEQDTVIDDLHFKKHEHKFAEMVPIQVVELETLTPTRFRDEFVLKNMPCIIRRRRRKDFDEESEGLQYLIRELAERPEYQEKVVDIDVLHFEELLENGPSQKGITTRLKWKLVDLFSRDSYMWYMRLDEEGKTVRNFWPELFENFTVSHNQLVIDLLRMIQVAYRVTKVRIGAPGYKYPLHFDLAHNLAQQLVGEKRVTLFGPKDVGNVYPPRASNFEKMRGYPFWSDIIDPYRDDAQEKFPNIKNTKAHVATLFPGDLLYIPVLYWHFFESVPTLTKEPTVMANTFFFTELDADITLKKSAPPEWFEFEANRYKIIP